jgi:hypothetical protein
VVCVGWDVTCSSHLLKLGLFFLPSFRAVQWGFITKSCMYETILKGKWMHKMQKIEAEFLLLAFRVQSQCLKKFSTNDRLQ